MQEFKKISNKEKLNIMGLNIAKQRKLKNITQARLAEMVGISRTYISNIEAPNITTSVSLEVLFNIADILEIPVSTLLDFN